MIGQAGLLESDFDDEYPLSLQKEYRFLQVKFKLKPIETHLWKLLRLRPSNFPAVRLAQFVKLIYSSESLFSSIVESNSLNELKKLLSVELTGYWETHYLLDKQSVKRSKKLGNSSVDLLLINTVIPFMFVYGKRKNKPQRVEKAIEFLHQIKAEKNSIISDWEHYGVKVKSAFESQAMIQLKNEYCTKVRCLDCAIGNKIVRS